MKVNFFLILLLPLTFQACSWFGPYEENKDMQVPEGPGVFTGESGELSLSNVFSDKNNSSAVTTETTNKSVQQSQTTTILKSGITSPAIGEKSFEEFEQFKAWRRAQDPSSPEYQDFQDWRNYQQYLRSKQKEN